MWSWSSRARTASSTSLEVLLALPRRAGAPSPRSRRSASGAAPRTRGPRAATSRPARRGGARAARRCRASPARCAAASPPGSDAIVRMLCRRSASLISRTRTSLAIATSILRIVAACCASLESNSSRSSLVTPSTIAPTSSPNSATRSSSVSAVSSTASCSSAPASVTSSRPRSARIIATPSGCAMYGSPDRRIWSRCASRATT